MSAENREASDLDVRVTQRFAAPAERVFDAWLDPESLTRWMFGPAMRDEEIVRLQIDPRAGAGFSFRVRRGGEVLDHVGDYAVLERPLRLEFGWGIAGQSSSRVSVRITPAAQGCELELIHRLEPEWRDFAARTRSGWARMLDMLDRNLCSARQAKAMPAQSFGRVDAGNVLHMERLLPAPPGQAWNWFAERAPRAHRLAEGDIPLSGDGPVDLLFDHAELSPYVLPAPEAFRRYEGSRMHGRLVVCEASRVLAFTWGEAQGDGEVRFELSPRGEATALVLTHTKLSDMEMRIGVAAGWHTHLAMLLPRMQGAAPPAFWPLHMRLREEYAARFAIA